VFFNSFKTVVNERDELGSDLVPDYLTSVPDGSFFGWPYSYYGQHLDERVQPQRPDLVAKARMPDYALYRVIFVPFRDGQPFGGADRCANGFC
jgi:glucose/arabinose dehydrogenase